jgi:hypothetical protein
MKSLHNIALKNILALAIASTTATASAAFNDEGTNYTTDPQRYHVWNEALKPIELVNSILCFTGQFKANSFVNAGPYIALADEKACFEDEGNSDASAQSAGSSNTPAYVKVIVEATRGDGPTDPLIVKVWMPEMGGGEDESQSIRFKSVISKGASEENPFGSFTFNFAMFDSFTSGISQGGGEIKTVDIPNKIGFTFFENELREEGTSSKSASVVMSADRSSGVALTSNGDSGGGGGEGGGGGGGGPGQANAFGLAFNANNVLLQTADSYANLPYKADNDGSGTESCLNRTAFDETVGRYDLYSSADGSRVELNSGLAFKYDSDDNSTFDSFGHVGYWGVWAEKPNLLVNGATIQVETPGTHTTTDYTIIKAPGRLIKNTVQQLPLSEAHGIEFSYWSQDAQQSNFNNWIVQYLTTSDDVGVDGFYKTGGSQNGEQGPMVMPLETPVLIVLGDHESLHMHSQQLGGNIQFTEGNTSLTFFKQEFVNGSETTTGNLFVDGPATLVCIDRCPVGTLGATELASWDSAYSPRVTDPANAIMFTIDNTGENPLALIRDSNGEVVKYADGITEASLQESHSPNAWGIRSGRMITPDVYATLTNAWDIHNPTIVTVFYEWETGLNDFNKTTSIKDSNGVIQTFDKPIQITYTHTDAADRSGDAGVFDNKLFMLNYGGSGNLWGIPNTQSENGRYHPLFNIKDGTIIGANNQFVVKAREVEGTMQTADGQCASLTLTEPDAPVPTGITGNADIGDMPVVTSAPAVIGGVIQTPQE